MMGRIVQIKVADGGVPKLPIPSALVSRGGVAGERNCHVR
jgi:hypothetical protein